MHTHIATLDNTQDRSKPFAFLCGFFFIGHWWKDATPDRLMHTGHKRLECRRCTIQRWRFRTKTQEQLDSIMGIIGAPNRAARRKIATK